MAANSSENTRLVNVLEKVAISALFLIVTWMWNSQGKLEDRVYTLQAQSFSEEKARILEDRLMKNIDAIRSDVSNQVGALRNEVNSKLDLLIKMQADTKTR